MLADPDGAVAVLIRSCRARSGSAASWRRSSNVLAALIILEAAKVTDLVASELPRVAVSVVAALFGIGVLMNAISRSEKERRMAFVALSLSALCAIVALGS